MKRRAFLFASAILGLIPANILKAFRKPKRHSLNILRLDQVQPGMMLDWQVNGQSGTLKFIRLVEDGEPWTALDGRIIHLRNPYCNKWWVEHADNPGVITPCCFDLEPRNCPNMEFYT